MSALQSVSQELLKAKTPEEMSNLILGLFTESEIEELSQRIEIVRLLKEGVSQHEIAKRLGVGVATVTRGAKEIKQGRFTTVHAQ